ncbi:WD40-repeat-containing domain protein [Mycena maculata]|uniref:WD40-repeat-containing domain protein n=1 Tax=Mycena maculata TaxID=230809 RepID=A0AAD7HMD7_9AGAR|nr:WD40-repeat-containing domain protein [Mycena maculata]
MDGSRIRVIQGSELDPSHPSWALGRSTRTAHSQQLKERKFHTRLRVPSSSPHLDMTTRDGVPPASDPWVTELTRISVDNDTFKVATLSPNNAFIATVVQVTDICVYDVATSQLLHTFRGHTGHIAHLEFHPGGRKLVSSSSPSGLEREGQVRMWDLDAPDQCLDDLEATAETATAAAAPILLRRWAKEDLESAELQKKISELLFAAQIAVDVRNGRAFLGEFAPFDARAFSCDGRSLLYLPDRKTVAVLDVGTFTERFRLSGHTDGIMWAETSPNDTLVATSSWDRTVRIWSMESGESIRVLEGATGQSWSGAFSPDGELVAAGSGDQMVRIWRVDTGELLHTLSGFRGWVRTLSFSPDGIRLAAGASKGALRIFNVESGECEQSWQVDFGNNRSAPSFIELRSVQYTSRGDLFFCSTEGRIFGYRASDNLKWEFFESQVYGSLEASIDGTKLTAALRGNVVVWNIE